LIAAQLLQGGIGVGGLVAGIGIDQRAFLLEDRFAQQRDDVLALGEPLAAQAPIPVPPRLCPGTGSAYSSDTQSPGG
jgi:hypothetical protein